MGTDHRHTATRSSKAACVNQSPDADHARWSRFIATHSVPCPACKYELRGLDPHARVCPECGDIFDPQRLMFVGHDLSLGFPPGVSMLLAMGVTIGLHAAGHWLLPEHITMQIFGKPPAGWSTASLIDLVVTVPMAVAAAPVIVLHACSKYSTRHNRQLSNPFEDGIEWLDIRPARTLWVCAGLKLLILLSSLITLR